MPKVSIIVPVYNVEKYLPKCLDSLINQTMKDIEIICVNDGSTDGSLSVLKEYAKKDKADMRSFDLFKCADQKKERYFLMHHFLLNILKQQYNKCLRAPKEMRLKMLEEFQKELCWLKSQNLLTFRGHKLARYFSYKKLMKV